VGADAAGGSLAGRPATAPTDGACIQGIITKHRLMKRSVVVINGWRRRAPREGLAQQSASSSSLSNLFTTPLATGIPFGWKDLTPVAMMALDEFVLSGDAVQVGERIQW
jgi:putative tricarboxylic transport membrane protein